MNTNPTPLGEFDYIIVGAGSAGCVLAERLSAGGKYRVAVLEAGPDYRAWPVRVPMALMLLMRSHHYNWAFETVSQPALDNRRLFWPRGKVVGGSSSINAMCAVRGPAADFSRWAEAGGSEWDWPALAPLAQGITAAASRDNPRGLPFTPLAYHHPLSEAFINAMLEAGFPKSGGFNSDRPEGAGFYEVYQHRGERYENARGFFEPARTRRNLALFTHTHALRVEIDRERHARAVIVLRGNKTQRLEARREIILASGTLGSPQLLLLSGIGPAPTLRAFGIEVQHELAGVGEHLGDHIDVAMVYTARGGGGLAASPRDLPRLLNAPLAYFGYHSGPLTSNLAEAGGFIRSTPDAPRPDLQLHFLPGIQEAHGRKLRNSLLRPGCTLHVCVLYPQSRGRVSLASADPMADPLIDPNYLEVDDDLEKLVSGTRHLLRIVAQPALQAWRLRPFLPRRTPANDREIEAHIRAHAETIYHPVGTCRLGRDEKAVVDARLRVHGIAGLRIADASVMPSLIGGNTNFAATLIGERAARFILAENQIST